MELRGDIKCPCKSKADDCGFMIQCDKCRGWFHGKCVEIDSKRAETILSFHCSDCEVVYGHSIYREANRKSTRDKNNICYDEIRGVPTDELKYTKLLCTKRFVQHDFPEITGSELRVEYIAERGMRCPIIVRDPEGLDMKMPPNTITVDDIANSCGRDKVVDVLEVSTQSERMMTLDQWATYFALPQKERPRILNVITLEVSDSSIGKEIVRPKLVRDIDWIDHVWPRELKEEANYPRVQLYCLMSVKDCYTDFHIDFGGSSVYYHILSGSKVFYFIEPSPGNLKKYEAWTSSPDQATTYFADLVKDCYQVNLVAGNTMIIPTGWIHAVYTPADSIVIGGNFLHGFNIGTQFDIYDIEKRTHVPPKFRFPYFEMMNWYASRYYLIKIRENPSSVQNFELKGLLALCLYLQRIAFKLTDIGGVTDKEERKEIKRNIPKTLKNVQKLIRKLYDKVKEERKVRKTLITRDDEEGEEEGKQKVAGLEKRQEEKGTEGDSENESEEDDEVEDKEAAAEKEILGRAIFFKVSKFSHGNLLPEPNNALPKITLKMNQEEIDPALLSDDWDENLTEMEFFDSEPEDIIPEEEEDSDYDEEFATKPIQRKRNVSSTEDQNFIPKKKKAVSEPSPEVLIPFKNHSIPIEDRKPTITAADLPKPEIKQYIPPPKPVVKKNPPGKHGKVFSKLMKMSRR